MLLLREFLRIRDYGAHGDYDLLLQYSNEMNSTIENEYPVMVGGNKKMHRNNFIMAITTNEELVEREYMILPLQLSVTQLWP